ncbi:MAG: CpaF family protein [Myxococcales bacterium]|nr:CpaF family protein [Myxococcales bacterium]
MIPEKIYEQTLRGFFAPISPFLDDDSVSEIMINGPETIFVERRGRLEKTDAKFASSEDLFAAIRNLAQYVGRHFDEDNPVLEARLPDGSRVEAIIPPAAPEGPSVAIRRFSRNTLTIARLVEYQSMTPAAAQTLGALVAGKQNIVVAGGTASGKTSMLNAMSGLIPKDERIVTIEDARELQLQQPHLVPLEAQPADSKGRGKVSIRDLFKATLRMRPDRIIVGEIRGGEALDLIQSLTSGHGGGMTTVHASHSLDTLNRLETMAMMSDVEMPLYALRSQVASAVDFLVHVSRLADGSRRVTQITEVRGFDPKEGYELVDIFLRNYVGRDADGRILSSFDPTGEIPSCLEYLGRLGHPLPTSLFQPSAGGA